ncbi:MAG: hypothetical protein AAGD43_00835 [Pseudomonadota bacterium]
MFKLNHIAIRTLPIGAVFFLLAGCSSGPRIDPSNNADGGAIVGQHRVADLTPAPERKVVVLEFDRTVEQIFQPLLAQVELYSDDVVRVDFDHTNSSNPGTFGVGSVRICTFKDGTKLVEPIVAYEENRFYAYTTDAKNSTLSLPVKDVLLFYSFQNLGTAKTRVTVRAHYTATNWWMSPIVGFAFNRNINSTFASAAKVFGGRQLQ